MNTPRPDPNDLTPIVSRLSQAERDEHERLKWQAWACWVFWGLCIACGVLFIIWGCRQLP